MYKLVAIDLDGTLLDSYGKVSDYNKEALIKAQENGVMVVLSSGRPIASVKSFAQDIGAKDYIVCGNGAILYDLKKDEIAYGDYIDRNKVLKLIKICDDNSIFYSVYTDKLVLTKSYSFNMKVFNYENLDKPEDKKTNIKIVDNIYDYIEKNEDVNVLKITICDEDKVIFRRIINIFKEIPNLSVLDVAHMSRKMIRIGNQDYPIEYFYTEITNENVNKWKAIEKLIEIEKINQADTVGIGDNLNDKELIQNSGLGILMANADPKMQEYSDVMTDDNNSDGVGKAIYKYVL